MAKPLSILFVSSEVFPFAKAGGIADVSYSLPLALRELGHDVRVMLPKYGSVSERKNRIHEINRLRDIPIKMGKEPELATVKSSSINNPRVKVQAYITTNKTFFDSKRGIYRDPKTWEEYPDNPLRFIFFSRSVIETCLLLGWYPDIIHCNDWQTALIPAFVKKGFPKEFKKTKVVFTVHNFRDQGAYTGIEYKTTGLPKEIKQDYRHKNRFNFMKGALIHSDYVTTVSPSYETEMLEDKTHGNGLETLLDKKNFKGILNGIDIWGWNPEKDKEIESKYDGNFEDYKYDNKVALVNKAGFEFKPRTPLIGMITRLDSQKGVSLFIEAADELFKEDLQVIILGKGDAKLKNKLSKISKKYPEKLKLKFGIDEPRAHLIEAGSDMFLLPSQYEPCGLNLMYSLVYGSVPIVRATGGMKDIAEDYDEKTKTGNSFVFKDYKANDLVKAVKRALKIYNDQETWEQLAKNGMEGDYSWDDSAKEYDEIYRSLLKE